MTTEEMKRAQKLFAGECNFVLAAAEAGQFPKSKLLEVAIIGRSNVGKSSLINALVGRKNLARASNTPGRTQQIIFFNLADRLMLVDLPGYGHAKAPRHEREKWDTLVQSYLAGRPNLRLVLLLLDGRHGVMANDREMMAFLDRSGIGYRAVLTKADKVKAAEVEATRAAVEDALKAQSAALPGVMVTSSDTGDGVPALRALMAEHALKLDE